LTNDKVEIETVFEGGAPVFKFTTLSHIKTLKTQIRSIGWTAEEYVPPDED
jgi:hypothetical protein